MMKVALAIMFVCASLLAGEAAFAGEEVEQKPGQPLYLPGDRYQPHESDLAPNTDPYWRRYQDEQQRRINKGLPPENPYEEPPTIIREETTRYEIVDDGKKKSPRPPSRWSP